ncbi:hypothetical protein [Streptomyces spiralis]|uniref:hypothetical protein n=1 Tax=Streptomyces spiralis TaxID=66376 RepID=UPI00167B3E8A|nr:hypothetical protein [Streptomyces spiralis]
MTTGVALFWNGCTANKQAAIDDDAQSALNAKHGYVHALIRPMSEGSYSAPYRTFSKTRLTSRQVKGINRGEYTAAVVKNGVQAVGFGRGSGDQYGQVYFVDLVSDSSSMVTVTDIDAVNVKCRKSEMVAEVETRGEGETAIKGLAYELQGHLGKVNGFISDVDDPKWGQQYFDHHTITLGGGADAQTLSILGVAKAGSYCTWDLQARFTTDDGQDHRVKINDKPLVTEGGPDAGAQHAEVLVQNLLDWACAHGKGHCG